MRFSNKACLITGAGSGIGRAAAIRFASEGADVLVADINEQGGNQTAELINNSGGSAVFKKTDVSIEAEIKAAVDFMMERWKKIDILVNNAAMMSFKKITDVSMEEWHKLMSVNLDAVFISCKYCIPLMNKGAIVNISSVHAHESTAQVIPYASSKGAVEAFSRGVSLEYPRTQLRINCVAPGAVDTPMLWNNPNIKAGREKVDGIIGKPDELAAAICFLASDDASFINGTTLIVDGGRLDIL